MTTAVLAIGSPRIFNLPSDRGVSPDASRLYELVNDVLDFPNSISIGDAFRETVENLLSTVDKASKENWDAYGARPVSYEALSYALGFLNALPTTAPKPDISVHPDGDIAFEWYRGPRNVFTVSMNKVGDINFAGLYGRSKIHGVEHFANEIPESVAIGLRRVYSK
jgi:hypothetical protein